MTNQNPPKWHQVYPQGSNAGNEECKFFIALARHPKFAWRSVSAVAKESGLSRKRVEEILNKYFAKGMVFPSPKNEDNWGYWERVPEMLTPASGSLASKDQKNRIDKVTGNGGGTGASLKPSKKTSSTGGASKGALPVYDDDDDGDDDDDVQCKVKPMGGVPAKTANTFRIADALRDSRCDGR